MAEPPEGVYVTFLNPRMEACVVGLIGPELQASAFGCNLSAGET
jgi:hypothetical protein